MKTTFDFKKILISASAFALSITTGCNPEQSKEDVEPVYEQKGGRVESICPGVEWGGYCTDYSERTFNPIAFPLQKTWNGHAGSWFANAQARGWKVSTDFRQAEQGAIIVWSGGTFGHVGISEGSIIGTNQLSISEMNWGNIRSSPVASVACFRENAITENYGRRTTSTINISAARPLGINFNFVGYIFPRLANTPDLQLISINNAQILSSTPLSVNEWQLLNVVSNLRFRAEGTFTVQLSNSDGVFLPNSPTTTILASSNENAVRRTTVNSVARIPVNITSSSRYKLRVHFIFANGLNRSTSLEVPLNVFSNISILRSNRTLSATNVLNASYQWFRNGTTISGANTATYNVPANITGVNRYDCHITRNGLIKTASIIF